MTVKEYLSRAYRLNELICSYQREVDELKSLALSLPSQNASTGTVTTSKDNSASYTRIVEKAVALESKIARKIEDYITLKNEIHSVIEAVENNDEKLCLRYRYIELMTWEQIAQKMNFSVMQVTRIHGQALKKIVIPEKML